MSASRRSAMRTMWRIASSLKTEPVGLCGELTTIMRVRGLVARWSRSGSGWKSGATSGTGTSTAPASAATAA